MLIVEPGPVIHISRGTPNANQVQLKVWWRQKKQPTDGLDYTLQDVTASGFVTYSVNQLSAPADLVAVSKNGSITPINSGTGENRITVTYQPPSGVVQHTAVLTVHVHNELTEWWFGDEFLFVPVESRVFHTQATVYAHFDANPAQPDQVGTIGDITGHRFVTFTNRNPARYGVDSRGRLKGLSAGHTNVVGSLLGRSYQLGLKIVDFYGDPATPGNSNTIRQHNAILKEIRISGPPSEKHNILILGEGFNSASERYFDEAVQHIDQELFTNARHNPFKILRDDFNVWSAFKASDHDGITYAPPVDNSQVSELPTGKEALLKNRNSWLGLYYPKRPADLLVETGFQDGERNVNGDPRRFPLEMHWVRSIERFIATLANPNVSPSDPDYRVGKYWEHNPTGYAKDFGMVFILINDRIFQEGNYGVFSPVAISYSYHDTYTVTRNSDHAGQPDHPLIWNVKRNHDRPIKASLVTRFQSALDYAVDTLVHEFGHSLVLGDEYENSGVRSLQSSSVFDNIAHIDEITSGGSGTPQPIAPAELKWRQLHLVTQSDRIFAAAWNTSNLNNIKVTLTLGNGRVGRWATASGKIFARELRWTVEDVEAEYGGISVPRSYYRILPNPNEEDLIIFQDLTIDSVSSSANQVTLKVPRTSIPTWLNSLPQAKLKTRLSNSLHAGSVLYVPELHKKTPRSVIHHEVFNYMNSRHNALHRNHDASQGNNCARDRNNLPDFPPNKVISNARRRLPSHSYRIVGAYEGGDHATCDSFRPTGFCKMRSYKERIEWRVDRTIGDRYASKFCFVCQYLIVNRINSSKLEALLDLYPRIR